MDGPDVIVAAFGPRGEIYKHEQCWRARAVLFKAEEGALDCIDEAAVRAKPVSHRAKGIGNVSPSASSGAGVEGY